jgi:surfactin synthase thioesterase subunit
MHLFVSGCEAPCVVQNRRRYELPRDEFIAVLHGMDCPPQVLQSEELMEVFEPVLRADFEANDTFEYQRQAPFKSPITVMIGTEEETSREEALKWQQVTVQEIVLVEFSGGHFFIFDHLSELGRIISQRLSVIQTHTRASQRWKA